MVQNWPFFEFFFLGNIGQENVLYGIVQRKTCILGYKNKNVKQSKNWHFSKGVNPWFSSKNGNFSNFFFSGNIGQETVFYNILEQKNSILGYKNKRPTQSKNCHFSKGVNSRFWSKNSYFCKFFFLGNIRQENVFYVILERKTPFSAIIKRSSTSWKNWHFSKRVNPWFWSKNGHFFQLFVIANIGHEYVFYDILEERKRLSSL